VGDAFARGQVVEGVANLKNGLNDARGLNKREGTRTNRARTGLAAPTVSKELSGNQVRATTQNAATAKVSTLRTNDNVEAFKQEVIANQTFEDRALQEMALETIQDGREVAASLGLNGPVYGPGYRECLSLKGYSEEARANGINTMSELISAAKTAVGDFAQKRIEALKAAGAKLASLTQKGIDQGACALATLAKPLSQNGSCEIINGGLFQEAQSLCAQN
ncbi:MAG: hypothetical protein KDD40_08215, partial [Bdellovibrionales bacterium]|nr:hypothetical protein [Bdellovibrionales bacterium]